MSVTGSDCGICGICGSCGMRSLFSIAADGYSRDVLIVRSEEEPL